MNFTRRTITALILVCVMLLVSACSLVSVNEDRDNAQTVATVNGVSITKGEFNSAFNEIAYYYSMFGMELTEDIVADIRTNTLDTVVMDEVNVQKAKELGFDKLSAEEQAEIDQNFDDMWQSYVSGYAAQAETEKESNPNLDVNKRAEELLLADMEKEGMTKDTLKQNLIDQKVYAKLRDSINAEVVVTDEDIKADYDTRLAEQKAEYAETPENYETDEGSGEIITYIPPGYIRVKHVLVAPADDDEEYQEYQTKLETLNTEQTDLASQMTELIVEDKTANQLKIDDLEVQINAKKQEAADMRAQFFAKLQPEADEVLAKARSGEDFDSLIETYGKDPGMQSSPDGYLISRKSSMVPEFLDASFALQNVGDISEPTASEYGYHIIQLVEKVNSAEVPLDSVKEAIRESLTSAKQTELWNARQEEWKTAAKIETFPDVVKNVGLE